MNIILLSGGSGKRLWPLSNDVRSKQFIKIFNNGNKLESMIQMMYRQILNMDFNANIVVATSETQVSFIQHQIGFDVDVCVEPSRRDTFPAIALAASYLHDVKHVSLDEPVIVCPVDPYVDESYFNMIFKIFDYVKETNSNLVLLGIEPTYPSEKYGYIIPETNESISKVKKFKEKPSKQYAEKYIENGALWNGGVFGFKLDYMVKKTNEILKFSNYYKIYDNYNYLDKISFDYAVVEKEDYIDVIRFKGKWDDLGTWNSFSEALSSKKTGLVYTDEKSKDNFIINELNIPMLCMGLSNTIITVSKDGILVSDKSEVDNIKKYVDEIPQYINCHEEYWGTYNILDLNEITLTTKMEIQKGKEFSRILSNKTETLFVLTGYVTVIIDGDVRDINTGDQITIPDNSNYSIIANELSNIVSIQVNVLYMNKRGEKNVRKKDT